MKKHLLLSYLLMFILAFTLSGCSIGNSTSDSSPEGTGSNNPSSSSIPGKQSQGKISGLDDLKNKRIAVVTGTIYDIYTAKTYPDAKILHYNLFPELTLALEADKVDAIFLPRELDIVDAILKKGQVVELASSVFLTPIGTGFKPDNDALREEFNAFLKGIRSDGTYADMVKRWIKDGNREMPVIDTSGNNGTLVVGTASEGFPWTSLQNGRFTGFDIELAQRFAASRGQELEIKDMPFTGLLPAVATGKVDMIACFIMMTDERMKMIDFSDPYYQANATVLINAKNIAAAQQSGFNSPEDIKDKKIGAVMGSVHLQYVLKNFPEAEVMEFNSFPDLMLAVKTGKVDTAMMVHETLLEYMKKDPDIGVLAKGVMGTPIAVGFHQEDDDLREDFNKFLMELKNKGIYDDMFKRWVTNSGSTMPVIETPNRKGTLTLGNTSTIGPPWAFKDNGALVGFDIELMKRFAAYREQDLKIVDMEFGSLIAALTSRKVDLIAASISVTEERSKSIDFSDPYHSETASFFALKKNIGAYGADSRDSSTPSFLMRIRDSFHSNLILENRWKLILDGFLVTLLISLLSAVVGTAIAALVCFMSMSGKRILTTIAKFYIWLLRGTPVLVMLMIIFYVIFASVNISPLLVAVLAFGFNFGAYVSEVFRTAILSINRGQQEAGIAMGFSGPQTFLHIILPQALERILPIYKGEFISMMKMTSVVGYIAVQDLTKASDIIRSRTFDAFFPLLVAAVLYLILAWLFTAALSRLELRFGVGKRSR